MNKSVKPSIFFGGVLLCTILSFTYNAGITDPFPASAPGEAPVNLLYKASVGIQMPLATCLYSPVIQNATGIADGSLLKKNTTSD
jgi:hypothetical protein